MKHLHTLFLVAVAATLSVMAALSNADMSAAVNASPSVSIVRLANVKGNTRPGDFNGDGLTDLVIRRPGPHEPQHGVDGNSGVRRSDGVGMSISVHRRPRAAQLPHPGRQSGRPRGI